MLWLETGWPVSPFGPLTQPPLICVTLQCWAKPKIRALLLSTVLASVVIFFVSSCKLSFSGLKNSRKASDTLKSLKIFWKPWVQAFQRNNGDTFLVVDSSLFCLRWSHSCGIVHWHTLSSDVNQLYALEIIWAVPSYTTKNQAFHFINKFTKLICSNESTLELWEFIVRFGRNITT